MKPVLLTLLLIFSGQGLFAQAFTAPDTLLNENFEIDPTPEMLSFPNGDDVFWVNWDEDGAVTDCAVNENGEPTVSTWYWEYDLSQQQPITNNAFTSCSFGVAPFRSRNWLIAPPVYVADSTYVLSWRSSAYQGPFFVDGYHVLVSKTGNFPGNFTDTIYRGAETTTPFSVAQSMGFPLDVSKYTYSPGYIQADAYTKPEYYFFNPDGVYPFFQGKLEPHHYWLKDYVGKTIYVAYLHDSFDDYILQVDDILMARDPLISATHNLAQNLGFQISPNPVAAQTTLRWNLVQDAAVNIHLYNGTGQLVWESPLLDKSARQYSISLHHLPAGVYQCVLKTDVGVATLPLVKI
jgi:hypothetical protein